MASASTKTREVVEGFRTVAFGRGGMFDAILPPLAFLLISALKDSQTSMLAALLAALLTAGALAGRRA